MDTSAKSKPIKTQAECVGFMKKLGLQEGRVLIVHQAISSLYPLENHALTLLEALLEALGPQGTLCVINSMPSNREIAFSIPEGDQHRKEVLSIPMRTYRNSFQSPLFLAASAKEGRHFLSHPKYSLCCIGKYAKYFTDAHGLDFPFGTESCFESMYELKADYLMIDVNLSDCEELNYYLSKQYDATIIVEGASLFENGENQWKSYLDYQSDSGYIARVLKRSDSLRHQKMNQNHCYLINYTNLINDLLEERV